jgi:hypothetical protein
VCARSECPDLVRNDCAEWIAQVDSAIPSVVVAVRTPGGELVSDVRVTVDGRVERERLDGTPFDVDPGPHVFRFESSDGRFAEESRVIVQGDKGRMLNVTLSTLLLPPDPPPVVNAPTTRSTVPLGSFVLGGVGVVGLSSFGYFAWTGYQAEKQLRVACSPRCTPDEVSNAQTRYIVADVSLAAGVLSLGAALWIAIAHARSTHARRSASPTPFNSVVFY